MLSWEPHRKGTAGSWLACDRDLAPVSFHELPADGQPQAGAGRAAAPARFPAVEALEEVRLIFGGNARTGVDH